MGIIAEATRAVLLREASLSPYWRAMIELIQLQYSELSEIGALLERIAGILPYRAVVHSSVSIGGSPFETVDQMIAEIFGDEMMADPDADPDGLYQQVMVHIELRSGQPYVQYGESDYDESGVEVIRVDRDLGSQPEERTVFVLDRAMEGCYHELDDGMGRLQRLALLQDLRDSDDTDLVERILEPLELGSKICDAE